MTVWLLPILFAAQFFPAAPAARPTAAPAAREASGARSGKFTVAAWTDTAIDVSPGDRIFIQATGTLRYPNGAEVTPIGVQKGWRDLLKAFPVNDAPRGALVARIGQAAPFLVSDQAEAVAPIAGRLHLGVNHPKGEEPSGGYEATLRIEKGAARPAIDVSQLPRVTQEQLDSLPRRVTDADGTEGDRVNFLVIGEEQKLVDALKQAGWVIVNRSTNDAVIGAAISILNRRGYVEMPMSELLLFDRVQDYGFAHADPLVMVAARHHFRIWKAPFLVGGRPLWVGAGTHDIGFDKDQRNGKVTHKIDSDTDKEREYIGETLRLTGVVADSYYLTHRDPVTKAKTAHGQEYFSDGRTLILVLMPEAQ